MTYNVEKIELGPKRVHMFDGWHREVTVDGVKYSVGVARGMPVRIRYKPRGQNIGFEWSGFVRDASAKTVWSGPVPKSLGVRGILIEAGLLPTHRCKPGRGECLPCSRRSAKERDTQESRAP